jgi:hypothetical protein
MTLAQRGNIMLHGSVSDRAFPAILYGSFPPHGHFHTQPFGYARPPLLNPVSKTTPQLNGPRPALAPEFVDHLICRAEHHRRG